MSNKEVFMTTLILTLFGTLAGTAMTIAASRRKAAIPVRAPRR